MGRDEVEAIAGRSPRLLMGRERGDTFVEIILAVALVGIALVGITGAVSTSLVSATRLSGGEHLQALLQECIADIQSAPYSLSGYASITRKGVTCTLTLTQITDKLQRILISANDGANTRVQTIFKGDR